MKRSSAVRVVLVTTAAAAMTACKERATRYCVDADNRVSDDRQCEENQGAPAAAYHWYYGGAHGAVPLGTTLSGGSTLEPADGFSDPGTVRGNIGGAGESESGHGSSAAGEGAGSGE